MSDEDRASRIARALHIDIPFIKSIPAGAQWIAGVTLLIWIFKAVVLDTIPEIFPRASALGGVVDGLFSAIIAGYIFYILFALWPDYKEKQLLANFISTKVRGIVGDCLGILNELNRHSHGPIDIYQSDVNFISSALVSVKGLPNTVPQSNPSTFWNHWLELFIYRQQRSRSSISDLFQQGRYLDPNLVSILASINDSAFFNAVLLVATIPKENTNLDFWASSFSRYLASCRRLAEWHDAHRPPSVLPLLPEH